MGPAAVEGDAMTRSTLFALLAATVARRLRAPLWFAALALFAVAAPIDAAEEPATRPDLIVVVGAAGADEYREPFQTWAERWRKAADAARAPSVTIGLGGGDVADGAISLTDRERLRQELAKQAGQGDGRLWIVLIGHGTFDGKTARLNLRGEDVTPVDLREWLGPIERSVAVLDCTSCSAPFLTELSAPNRVVIAATRSGSEFNFARFGDALSAAVTDRQADLDKDEQSSLLEAYLYAAARTAEFYASQTRLQTEHALLDDNGDKLGTPAEFYEGLKAAKSSKSGAAPDGGLASRFVLVPSEREARLSDETRQRRDELERELGRLRAGKDSLEEPDYWRQVERIVTEIARLYEEQEKQ